MVSLLQQLNEELAGVVEQVQRSLVQVRNGGGSGGAGTIWHPDGLIITSAHVVQSHSPHVVLPDGRTLPGRVLAWDRSRDLLALAVEATGLPSIQLGESRRLQPGQLVLALGHPWGVVGAVTTGVVIGLGRPAEGPGGHGEMIQVDLHLRPGYSGGPLVDGRGHLVGINTMIAGPSVGLVVPVHVVKAFLRRALEGKESPRAAATAVA